ncbi:MAG: aspartate dehydrogenase [Lachnospiraceae bacterium]|nr:aspartate dehydrogenase [Lachnospiraceae bacterium]
MLFGKKGQSKKGQSKKDFDRENKRPVLKCSICNGEQVAGFKDIHTGKFEEVMLIRNERDLEAFRELYGIEGAEIAKEY